MTNNNTIRSREELRTLIQKAVADNDPAGFRQPLTKCSSVWAWT